MTIAEMPRAETGASFDVMMTPPKKKCCDVTATAEKKKKKRSLGELYDRLAQIDAKRRCAEAPTMSPTKVTNPVAVQTPPPKDTSKADLETPEKSAAPRGVSSSPSPQKRATLAMSAPGTVQVVKVTPGYEPIVLKKLLEAHDVPLQSSELLLPLLQQWGSARLQQVLDLWNFLGEGSAGSKSCNLNPLSDSALSVWGPRGTGKSALVEDYLQRMRFPYVKLSGLGVANRAEAHQQLVSRLTCAAIKQQRSAKSELESLDPAAVPKHLRQLDQLQAALDVPLATLDRLCCPKVIIVLDHVEELCHRIGKEGLELLMKLPETLPHRGSMLALVLIGRQPLTGVSLRARPSEVCFPSYTFAEIEVLIPHLLSQKYPDVMYSLGEANWIVVMTCLMQSARPIFGVDLRLLLDVGSDVLSEVRRSPGVIAVDAGEATGRKLKKTPSLGETTERINDLVREACRGRVDLKPFAGQASHPVALADAVVQRMTKAEKQVLLATYLGSYVHNKDDRRLFLGIASRRKVIVRKKKEDDDIPCWEKAPKSVSLMRLVAIYHKIALARTSLLLGNHFWLTLVSLKEAGFVRIRNERGFRIDRDIKVDSLASLYIARACAMSLEIDLAEYLC
mmetsp:Transcript_44858/g.104777  ORF Transcript_44858/g.104777 Transcript_44858/m.104777 type:complete len:620 (+) Transcript_44858:85-1944(+)